MLWVKDKFGGFSWYDPTWNSISDTVFTHSRAKQRLFRSSGSSWVIVRLVYIAQALCTCTCRPLSPESILAGTDLLVVSIGTQPEAFLSGSFMWVYRQPGHSMKCCCQGRTSLHRVSVALRILSQLPGCTFLIFCSRKFTHFTEKSFSRDQRMS